MSALLLSDDLIFTSRITGTGADLGLSIRAAKSSDALLALAQQQSPVLVILDLSNPGLNITEMVAALKQFVPAPNVVAYGSHVDTATLKAARAAGCDVVMPRSQFVEQLPLQLAAWMGR